MKKVNRYTRAGKNGKCIACPNCGRKSVVYHFAWCASECTFQLGGCGLMIEKNDWLVVG